jgi:hypothetical protein
MWPKGSWQQIVSSVETVFEFGEAARDMLAAGRTVGAYDATLMVPSAMLWICLGIVQC